MDKSEKETYYSLQISLAKVAKNALENFCKDTGKSDTEQQIINKIILLTLGDLDQLKNNILQICEILNINPTTATINQFIERIK